MKATWFIFVTLAAGTVGGTIFGIINLAIAEPLIDKAIGFEVRREANAGQSVDLGQLADYRDWQKGGAVVSAVILGMALAAIFGIVFAYARKALPTNNNTKKAVILAGIMLFTLFFVTSLKYPANPPAVEAPNTTIYFRQELYVAFLAISGLGALGAAFAAFKYKERVKPVILFAIIYAPIVTAAYFALPDNDYQVTDDMNSLVTSFRIASALTMAAYWAIMGLTFGLLWDKFKRNLDSNQRLTTA